MRIGCGGEGMVMQGDGMRVELQLVPGNVKPAGFNSGHK